MHFYNSDYGGTKYINNIKNLKQNQHLFYAKRTHQHEIFGFTDLWTHWSKHWADEWFYSPT